MKKKDRDCEFESHSNNNQQINTKVQYQVTIINTNVPFKYNYFLAADLSNKSLKLNSSPMLEIFRKSEV